MNTKLLVLLLVVCMVTTTVQWRRWRIRFRVGRILKAVQKVNKAVAIGKAVVALGKRDLESLRSEDEALAELSDQQLRELLQMTDSSDATEA